MSGRESCDAGAVKSARTTTKKPAAGKKPAAAAKPAAKKAAPAKTPMAPRRADYGKATAAFFAKQPAPLRPIVEALRDLVTEIAPDATSSLKWGMPFYEIGGETLCAIAGHKSHVNLILPGPPGTYADPENLLDGDGKTGRHLKLRTLDALPHAAVRGWLKTAAARARTA